VDRRRCRSGLSAVGDLAMGDATNGENLASASAGQVGIPLESMTGFAKLNCRAFGGANHFGSRTPPLPRAPPWQTFGGRGAQN